MEIDDKLIPILKETLQPYDNVEVLHGDILKQDIQQIADTYNDGKPIKVVANVTVMEQKEVADRMKAEPGTKDYGALSRAVQYYAKPYIAAFVPPNCFMPRPNVGSAVIRLDCLARVPVEVHNEKLMFRLIRASFNQRRKTLQNGIANSAELSFTKEQAARAIEQAGFDVRIRGEKLGLEEFARLADELERMTENG